MTEQKLNHTIKIFCHCQEPQQESTPGSTSNHSIQDQVPSTLTKSWALHKLEYLYFCDHCKSIKCSQCIAEEIVSRFCPSCLFEVTEASARASSNKCLRNCLQCPDCNSSVSASLDSDSNYILLCNYCSWKNGPPELILTKKTVTLGQQISNLQKETINHFSRFKEISESLDRDGVGNLGSSGTSSSKLAILRPADNLNRLRFEPFKKPIIKLIEGDLNDSDIEKDKVRHHGTITQPSSNLPNLVHLRSKTAKRCKVCRHSLTKPDPRPSSIKFKNKLLALNYLPSLYVEKEVVSKNPGEQHHQSADSPSPPNIFSGKSFLLTITNPLPTVMKINMSTSQPSATLITPQLELGACPELWDEESLVRAVPASRISRQTNVTKRLFMEKDRPPKANISSLTSNAIHDSGPNWVTVPIEIATPVGLTRTPIEIPLFLSISYEEDEDTNDQDPFENSSQAATKQRQQTGHIGVWYVIEINNL